VSLCFWWSPLIGLPHGKLTVSNLTVERDWFNEMGCAAKPGRVD